MVCHVCFFLVFAELARWLVFPKFYTLIIFSGFRVPLGPLVRRLLGGKPDELFDSRISTRNKQKKGQAKPPGHEERVAQAMKSQPHKAKSLSLYGIMMMMKKGST
ncbi:hypothetical protein BJ166DRAFT_523936, partial [Pestalotiopsis sp. NC0098]